MLESNFYHPAIPFAPSRKKSFRRFIVFRRASRHFLILLCSQLPWRKKGSGAVDERDAPQTALTSFGSVALQRDAQTHSAHTHGQRNINK